MPRVQSVIIASKRPLVEDSLSKHTVINRDFAVCRERRPCGVWIFFSFFQLKIFRENILCSSPHTSPSLSLSLSISFLCNGVVSLQMLRFADWAITSSSCVFAQVISQFPTFYGSRFCSLFIFWTLWSKIRVDFLFEF